MLAITEFEVCRVGRHETKHFEDLGAEVSWGFGEVVCQFWGQRLDFKILGSSHEVP